MPPCHSTTEIAADPATLESSSVAFYLALMASLRPINGNRLLFARLNWDAFFNSANPPGAPSPVVAKATYTRIARQQQKQRQMARRSGSAGLFKAIRAAA